MGSTECRRGSGGDQGNRTHRLHDVHGKGSHMQEHLERCCMCEGTRRNKGFWASRPSCEYVLFPVEPRALMGTIGWERPKQEKAFHQACRDLQLPMRLLKDGRHHTGRGHLQRVWHLPFSQLVKRRGQRPHPGGKPHDTVHGMAGAWARNR